MSAMASSFLTPSFIIKLVIGVSTLSTTFVSAIPSLHKNYAVKDYHPSPSKWSNIGRCPGDHVMDLSIGLKQGNFNELERHLYEVSDPKHSRYGQHLSAEEVHELVKPTSEAYDLVHEWLKEHGIESHQLSYSPAKDWIKITLSVEEIEQLLQTEYSIWEHDDGSTMARTEEWSLPLNIHDHISTIQPTNSWARLNPHKQRKELEKRKSQALQLPASYTSDIPLPSSPEIAAVCNFSAVTPDCLRTLYGTINYTTQSNGESRMGLTNYLEEYNNRSDAQIFLSKYRPEAAQAAYEFEQVSIGGGVVDNGTQHAADDKGFEGNLDAQYMLGIAWPLNLTAYSTAGRNPSFTPSLSTPYPNSDEPFLVWVNYILGLDPSHVPQVISTSYGDDEQTVSRSYAQAVCNQFAQLGARGVSLLFASGDFGVGQNDTCYSNKDNSTKQFLPSFPNDCPYVTNVGGTYMYPEQAAYAVLRDGSIFASGAGFSNYFDRPAYQSEVVDSYVKGLNGLNDGLYNSTGRAYPDIACVGERFPTIWNGTTASLVGTSGSTPICSAIFALVNDALLANNKPVLGFLNPWLYGGAGLSGAFTDVTNGSSYGCQTNGFPATQGWDAVTGFGSPYFPRILENLGIGSNQTGGGSGNGNGTGGGWNKWRS